MEIILSSCFDASTEATRRFATYSHLIPVVLALIIGFFIFIKAKKNSLSKIFLFFIILFSVWLIGDVIIWTSEKPSLIYSLWANLDYVEISFYVLALYFAVVFSQKKDLGILSKIILFIITIPGLFLTITQQSVVGFYQPWCEALNNNFLSTYKLVVESVILLLILFYAFLPFFRKEDKSKKRTNLVVLGSMFVFLATFAITEYIASITGIYEYNLYSLFLLPIFLLVVIYAVFELDIFKFKILGTHYLVVGLVILIMGQLFFTGSTTDRFLIILTLVITIGLSIILFRNLKKESNQRIKIEKLSEQLQKINFQLGDANEKLKGLDKLKTEFLSLASHQLRSPLTAIKGYASMLLDGSYGEIAEKNKIPIERIFQSSVNLALIVEDLLSVTKIEQGGMHYEFTGVDITKMAKSLIDELSISAKNKGLELTFENKAGVVFVKADQTKLRQVMLNFIDNSIKYTPKGSVNISVEKTKDGKARFIVRDTGVGMSRETKEKLFQKFNRGSEGERVNSGGSGLGLYLAKEIVNAHGGQVLAESDGVGKGSTFIMELPLIKNGNKNGNIEIE